MRLGRTPVPPWSLRSQVPGDFWAVGAEFRGYMVELGDLQPSDGMVDIGCRAGRMAIPLTAYLQASGRYDGVDDWETATAWCRREITSRFANFNFEQIAMGGDTNDPARPVAPLPFPDGFFDFALLVSINHLTPSAFDFYQAEAARVLRPEGTYFGTWYLRREGGGTAVAPPPIACSEADARARLGSLGLQVQAVHRGYWDGHEPGVSYQDIVIARAGEAK
jgi:SAM-dependent methyltransferase